MDPDRRRLLRLAALGATTMAGATYLLLDRLRGDGGEQTTRTVNRSGSTARPAHSATSLPPAASDGGTSATATAPSEPAPTTTSVASSGAASSVMLCRDAWGAAAPSRDVPPHQIRGLMVHHTAVRLDDNRQAPDRIRGHQRYHQNRGFADIAYHVFIDAHGNVYEGRDPAVPGETFTEYDTTGWFLVVCEGNFDEQRLPDAQRDALARVLAWASDRYGVPAREVASHRDHASTRCPGDAIHSLVSDGSLGTAAQAAVPASVEPLCGPEADSRITLIESGAL